MNDECFEEQKEKSQWSVNAGGGSLGNPKNYSVPNIDDIITSSKQWKSNDLLTFHTQRAMLNFHC